MAHATVSTLLEQLGSIISQQVKQEVKLVVGVKKEVGKLTSNLQAIQAVLEDAERREVKEASVKQWLDKLKDVCYDMEDVLDEWNTAILKTQITGDEKEKVCSFFHSCFCFIYSCFCCREVVQRRDIAIKIKDINERLDDVASEKDRYNFVSRMTAPVVDVSRMTASVIDVSELYGREKDKKTIVDMLLSESSQGPTLRIISIVGMGGIGKTTLAQLVFNDDAVEKHFQERIWVCVSDPFDEIRIAKAILESLKNDAPNLNELNSLLGSIHRSLEGKKFLLVLDDVWTEDCQRWEKLKNCLKCGSPGSKILVTTRKENVANVMGTTQLDMFSLGILSNEDCMSLFSLYAFSERTSDERKELEDIGWEIVDRCQGLPLAAKTLGSLLRFKKTREQWQHILNSDLWKIEEAKKGLFPPLLLSYYDLSSTMRRCFSYCAIFPKDYILEKDRLIYLWMAQGYLKEPMEMNGEECFENLAMHSLFQDFVRGGNGSIIRCKMHDIVHDFAQFLTKNECLVMEVSSSSQEPMIESSSYKKVRHLMMTLAGGGGGEQEEEEEEEEEEEVSIPISIYKLKNLRSLIIESRCFLPSDLDLPKLFDELTCLRTLEFRSEWGDGIEEVIKEVGKLVHLRYLNVGDDTVFEASGEGNGLEALPETVCELCNLQILNVSGCYDLERLPHGLGKLINLRHLQIDIEESPIKYMPKGIERLTCLRTLEQFVVSDGDNDGETAALGALKNLNHLRGRLSIKGLGNVKDVDEVKKAQLQNKEHLIELILDFAEEEKEEEEAEEGWTKNDEQVIEAIQPPPNLEQLSISEYRGRSMFLNWMTSLTNLKKVKIRSCSNCEVLPPLGKLSSLESLSIYDMPGVERVGIELLVIESEVNKNEGPSNTSSSISVIAFPKLKYLTFTTMLNWEEWEDYGMRRRMGEEEDITTATTNNIIIMPRLRSLRIIECPKLKALPHHLLHKCPSLQNLVIQYSPILLERYYNKERKRKGEEWPNISHIPNVRIDGDDVQSDGQPLSISSSEYDSESPDYTAQAPPEHSDSESTNYTAPPEDSDSESPDYTASPEH